MLIKIVPEKYFYRLTFLLGTSTKVQRQPFKIFQCWHEFQHEKSIAQHRPVMCLYTLHFPLGTFFAPCIITAFSTATSQGKFSPCAEKTPFKIHGKTTKH